MTQFLTSHEYFKSYFRRFKRAQTTVFLGGIRGHRMIPLGILFSILTDGQPIIESFLCKSKLDARYHGRRYIMIHDLANTVQ